MSRRFKAGDQFKIDGVHFRVREGDKPVRGGSRRGEHGHDLVLEWWLPNEDRWVRPTFAPLALMVDMLCENEDVLYPPPAKGGEYLIEHLLTARHGGHEMAARELAEDKAKRRRRDAA